MRHEAVPHAPNSQGCETPARNKSLINHQAFAEEKPSEFDGR